MRDCFECDAEKAAHLSDNKIFLNLIRMIWEDQGAIAHMSEETYGVLYEYVISWGWTKESDVRKA